MRRAVLKRLQFGEDCFPLGLGERAGDGGMGAGVGSAARAMGIRAMESCDASDSTTAMAKRRTARQPVARRARLFGFRDRFSLGGTEV